MRRRTVDAQVAAKPTILYDLDSLDDTQEFVMTTWQLHEAKNRLSELIDRALTEGPQVITRHGTEVAVVMPFAGFQIPTRPAARLGDFLMASPLRTSDLVIERDRCDVLCDIDL